MKFEILLAGLLVAGAIGGVKYVERTKVPPTPAATTAHTITPKPKSSYYAREVRLKAARNAQYYTAADVNRRPVDFLVDTGAYAVALRESDADRAGLRARPSDFTQVVSTANGRTRGAPVTIDEITLEGLRVRDVEAIILPDDSLNTNLLGMSFLSKLDGVETRDGEMILRQ